MENISELQIGTAGEHLVCADLILSGHVAFKSEQGLPFDIVSVIDGKMYRIQVKSTRGKRPVPQRKVYTPAYLFHIRRCGKGGRHSYSSDDFDFLALVALDTMKIAYVHIDECRQTIHLDENKFNMMCDVSRAVNYKSQESLL